MSLDGAKAIDIEELVKIEDSKKGAMFSRELLEKLKEKEEQRIAFIGEVTRARYRHKGAITEVYRNAAHIANPLVMQVVRDNNYPVAKDEIEDFFNLAKDARNGNVEARRKIEDKVNNVPKQMIQVLIPFYHEYMDDVNKESKEEAIKKLTTISQERRESILKELNIPIPTEDEGANKGALNKKIIEVLGKLSDEEVKKIRLNEAKIGFMGTVAFSFIEQRAQEMENSPNVVELQTAFRDLRNTQPEILNGLMTKLDEANKDFKPVPVIKDTLETASEAFKKIESDLALVQKANKEIEFKLKGSKEQPGIETALVNLCKELKDNEGDPEAKEAIEKIRLEFGNVYNKLNVAIGLKGKVITDQDVSEGLKTVVNTLVNGKSLITIAIEQGNKVAAEKMILAGAELNAASTQYKRSPLQALKDGFKGFPNNIKALFNKPPRTIIEIAEISGRKDIISSIGEAVKQRENAISEEKSKQNSEMLEVLDSKMSVKEDPTPKVTVATHVKQEMDLSSNPLFITNKPPLIVPLMSQKMQKSSVEPMLRNYLEDINMLLKEVEKAASEVDKSQSQEIKLIEVEKAALLQAKSVIEKSDISSPEGKADLSKQLQNVIGIAHGRMKEINHGMVINSDLSNKREELLRDIRHEIRSEVSQPQKRGPTSNQRG